MKCHYHSVLSYKYRMP